MLSPASMRFGVWRALPVSRRSRQAAVCEPWQVEWRLPRVLSVSSSQLAWVGACVLLSLALALSGTDLAWRIWLPGWLAACLLVIGACALLARVARDGEHIAMRAGLVRVTRCQGGQVHTTEFLPRWMRIEPEQHDRSLIRLSGQGRSVMVGGHIQPHERRQLADELRWALRQLDD
jgi:uncharacterized membrane protein